VATMLAQLLRQAGIHARHFRAGLPEATLAEVSKGDYRTVCISSISTFSVVEARSLCKRLRSVAPDLRIFMGLWGLDNQTAQQRLGPACPVRWLPLCWTPLPKFGNWLIPPSLRRPLPHPPVPKSYPPKAGRPSASLGRFSKPVAIFSKKIVSGISCSAHPKAIMPLQRSANADVPLESQTRKPHERQAQHYSACYRRESIKPILPSEPEKAQIAIHGADHLYREVRIENTLTDENGEKVHLKPGAEVEVTIAAEPEATTASD